jgi:hypothetical protein
MAGDEKKAARRNSFRERPQFDEEFVLLPCEKITFVFSENVVVYARPASARGAYRDRHDT